MTATIPTDRVDERLAGAPRGPRERARATLARIRGGDLGLLPVIVGLVLIWTTFQILNPTFLSSRNLSNLLMQSVAVGILALGIVCVLLIGEIDLSVGSVSGLAAAIVGINFVDNGWPLLVAVLVAILAGTVIGMAYSAVYSIVGVPSFVITLAGLLGFLGLQLFVLGPKGTINLPFDSPIVELGQRAFVPEVLAYAVIALAVVGVVAIRLLHRRERLQASLSAPSVAGVVTPAAIVGALLLAIAWYLYQDARGIGWSFVIFVALVLALHYALTRTAWGRSIYAIGGNREAARRAGIPVWAITSSAFMLCSTLAAIGGILAAGRLAASAQSSGGGDTNLNAIAAAVIGGTSLFGGRGTAFAALLGIFVIQSISSGLTLLNLDSSVRYMITGAVVVVAVVLDALSRRSRASHGRA